MNDFEHHIRSIVNDREHGSSTLVTMILDTLRGRGDRTPDASQARWALAQLRRIDASMVVVHHLLDALGSDPGHALADRLDRYRAQWANVGHQVATQLLRRRDWAHSRLLTHSHSGMLLTVIRQVHQACPSIELWQTRSEPGAEGVMQYQHLQEAGVDCHLISDEQAVARAPVMDAAWLGVDQYNSDCFVNKRGSAAITDAMLAAGKPVYVLGDSRKRVHRLKYSTRLFESIPLRTGMFLVTEGGVKAIGSRAGHASPRRP